MRIVYFGNGEFGLNCLDAVRASRHHIALIVTQPPNPAGRGRKTSPTPIAQWAESHSIPVLETDNVNDSIAFGKISAYNPDLILVIAFGQKVGKELVNLPPKGSINVHASLLPKYRGAAPINWTIVNGETKTGVSIITLADKMDAGKILAQTQMDIAPDETAGSLHDKLAELAAPLLLETIDKIDANTAVYVEQDDALATIAPKLTKSDGNIDFSESALVLERKIRGLWPWPGTSANYICRDTGKSVRVTFAMAQVIKISHPASLVPGTVDENLNIICGENALKIIKIKPSGSSLMDFKSFINGHHIKPGDSFVKIV
jgi:methionyl-tRNA formyltransferase